MALAAFRSPFTIEAAADAFGRPPEASGRAAPAGPRIDITEPIAELVEASLLLRAGDRYQMLQTVRDFAGTIAVDGADRELDGWRAGTPAGS